MGKEDKKKEWGKFKEEMLISLKIQKEKMSLKNVLLYLKESIHNILTENHLELKNSVQLSVTLKSHSNLFF